MKWLWPLVLATPATLICLAEAAPPTELELQTQRAIAAEQQNAYLIMVLQHQADKNAAIAAWWAEVWKALVAGKDR